MERTDGRTDRSQRVGGLCRTDGKADRRRGLGGSGVDRNSFKVTTPQEAALRLYPKPAHPTAHRAPKSENDFLLTLALSQIQAI